MSRSGEQKMSKRKHKQAYMSDETFAELIESIKQALEYERGAREGYRVTRVAISHPPQPMLETEQHPLALLESAEAE